MDATILVCNIVIVGNNCNGYVGFPYYPLVRPKRHGTVCDIDPKGEARTHRTACAIGPKGEARTHGTACAIGLSYP